MSDSEKAFGQYLHFLRQSGHLMEAGRPHWMKVVNEAGLNQLPAAIAQYHPAPGEEKQSRLDALFAPDYGVNLTRALPQADVAAAFRCGVPNLGSLLVVMAGDVFRPTDQLLKNMPEGLTVCSLRHIPAQYQAQAASLAMSQPDKADIATVLADALLQDGVYIRTAPGADIEKAVQILNLSDSAQPILNNRRILVHAAAGSRVRVLICDHTTGQSNTLNLTTVQVVAEDNATVEIYRIEENGPAAQSICNFTATQHHASNLLFNTTFLSGGTSRNTCRLAVPGNGANTNLSGLGILTGTQVCSTDVLLRHQGTHCTSRQMFKNAVFDSATGHFGGRIVVEEGAVRTDASQTNRNILQSASARMNAAPQLEIYCDDVKCSHGATTGQLDERALFYMQSRGIPRQQAQQMLTQAFMVDVIDNIHFEVLRQRLHMLVEKRLSGAAADCNTCAGTCAHHSDPQQ